MLTDKQNKEVLDRCRRIETRLTSYLEAQGHPVRTEKPTFANDRVSIPSRDVSLRDILLSIPAGVGDTEVEIRLGADTVAYLTLP